MKDQRHVIGGPDFYPEQRWRWRLCHSVMILKVVIEVTIITTMNDVISNKHDVII